MSATSASGLQARREGREVWTEADVSLLALLGGIQFLEGATDLRHSAGGWDGWAVPMTASAVLVMVAAIVPWVYGTTVAVQRALLWGGLLLASVVAMAAMVAIDLNALLGCQLVVLAAVLAELGGRPRVRLWFWGSVVLLWGTYWLYNSLVALRPIPD